jgi:hypothetical protein
MAHPSAARRPTVKNSPASARPGPHRAEKLQGSRQTKVLSRTTDSKGRVALGGKFANRPVIIEELSDTEIIVKLARMIPEREAWLYEDPVALAAVRTGLAHARAGRLTQGPDVDADAKLAAELEG